MIYGKSAIIKKLSAKILAQFNIKSAANSSIQLQGEVAEWPMAPHSKFYCSNGLNVFRAYRL